MRRRGAIPSDLVPLPSQQIPVEPDNGANNDKSSQQPQIGSALHRGAQSLHQRRGDCLCLSRPGPRGGVPLVLLNHWGAVLDNFDPRIVDGLASKHRVIATDYRGIGASGGTAPVTIDKMARDAIALIRALGFEKVDLLGFSLGGFVAQDLALKAPGLVRKLILTGTGPAGGKGIEKVGAVSWPLMIKGLLTLRDPKFYLFFTSTADGRRAAKAFLNRLQERKAGRDKGPPPVLSGGSSRRSKPGAVRRLRISAGSRSRS